MRRILPIVLATLLLPATAGPQGVPATMSFLGHLTDATGQPLAGNHSFTLRIFNAETGGSDLWSEIHLDRPVEQGLIYLDLGRIEPLTQNLFTGQPLWLDVIVDGTTLAPRLPLQSVPYAFRAGVAQTAENLGAYPAADYVRRVELPPGATSGEFTCITFDINWADWCFNYQTDGGMCDTALGFRLTGQEHVDGTATKTCICCKL